LVNKFLYQIIEEGVLPSSNIILINIMSDGSLIDSRRIIRYDSVDRIKNVVLLGRPIPIGPYLRKSQLVHSAGIYDSAGWEPQAIPA